jgi:SOS response regulatory protein OraA/RecX
MDADITRAVSDFLSNQICDPARSVINKKFRRAQPDALEEKLTYWQAFANSQRQ